MPRQAVPTKHQRVHRLQAQATAEMIEAVRQAAEEEGVSESVILRWAVQKYLDGRGKQQ